MTSQLLQQSLLLLQFTSQIQTFLKCQLSQAVASVKVEWMLAAQETLIHAIQSICLMKATATASTHAAIMDSLSSTVALKDFTGMHSG
jgi:hypothetical protein